MDSQSIGLNRRTSGKTKAAGLSNEMAKWIQAFKKKKSGVRVVRYRRIGTNDIVFLNINGHDAIWI